MKVLIVGASRGIGLEFVRQYRAAGDEVTATARSEAGLAALRELGASALALDVTSAESAAGLARQPGGAGFDVAVFVAGVSGPRAGTMQAPSTEDFDETMHANVLGPMRLLPQLAEVLAPGGKLVVLSSLMGSIGQRSAAGMSVYRASKAAVNSVLKDVSIELAGKAICISVHPGWVRTDMGGSGADIGVEESVSGLRKVIAGLKPADNGSFINYDGAAIGW